MRYSKQEVFHGFAQNPWVWLRGKNVPIVVDPERDAIESESEMSVASMLNIARQLRATSLLFITVDRPLTKWIKVIVQAYSLDGKLLWSEDASDNGSLTGKGGYEKTLKRIEEDLEKRLGKEGLSVVEEGVAPQDAAKQALVHVARDTPIKLKFAQSLGPKRAVVGERVEMTVAEDFVADGWVVVPGRTRVLGTVTTGKKKEKAGNSHDLALEVDYIAMGERHVKLGGRQFAKGRTSVDTKVASTIFLGLTGYFLAREARAVTIPEGTVLMAWVDEDIDLPALRRAVAQ